MRIDQTLIIKVIKVIIKVIIISWLVLCGVTLNIYILSYITIVTVKSVMFECEYNHCSKQTKNNALLNSDLRLKVGRDA